MQNNFKPIAEKEKPGEDSEATSADGSGISPIESGTGPDDIIDTDEESTDNSATQDSL